MSTSGTNESSPSKDSKSSSSIHHPSMPRSPILFNPSTLQGSNIVNDAEHDATQIAESSENINAPIYTRRLIPMKYVPLNEIDENFDEKAWFKKLYGPDIIVVSTFGLPEGWILVDGE